MKKVIFLFILFFAGFLSRSYAAAGNARDGLLFSVALIGFLLIVTGIFFFIDFIRKKGKQIVHRFMISVKDTIHRESKKTESPLNDQLVPF